MQGIMFKAEMTLANLGGRKTRTSRTRGLDKINENPDEWELVSTFEDVGEYPEFNHKFAAQFHNLKTDELVKIRCPFGWLGSELYGKETYCIVDSQVAYKASTDEDGERCRKELGYKWSSPMMMPETASRYHIILSKIIAQRIQDISGEDIVKEGIEIFGWEYAESEDDSGDKFLYWDYSQLHKDPPKWASSCECAHDIFSSLWDSINLKSGHGWEKNEWVWGLYYKVRLKSCLRI